MMRTLQRKGTGEKVYIRAAKVATLLSKSMRARRNMGMITRALEMREIILAAISRLPVIVARSRERVVYRGGQRALGLSKRVNCSMPSVYSA
jgi:hypothetical protein